MRASRSIILLLALLLPLVFVTNAFAENFNDFVIASYPIDVAIRGARDYEQWIYVAGKPSSGYPDTTSAWLAVYANGGPGNGFMQVGTITTQDGVLWFTSSDPDDPNGPTVQCLRGQSAWGGRGCIASQYGGLGVGVNHWSKVEIVTYDQGYWILRFWGYDGNQPYDVAKIYFTDTTIWRAEGTTEESWSGDSWDQDPQLYAAFYHYEPRYMVWESGFQPWISGALLYADPPSICPTPYGAVTGVQGNPRLWFAGTGGPECYEYPLF